MNEADDPALARALLDHLHGRREAMTALLKRLVLLETPTHIPESQTAALEILQDSLEGYDFRTRRIPGRKSGGELMAVPIDRPRGNPYQLLVGHCDTVWPVGTLEEMPLIVDDQRMHGPGVYDMKAGLIQALFAIDALRETGTALAVSPVFFVNSDEELGSQESTIQIRRLARGADRVFVLEPSLGLDGALKTARKGVARYTIHIQGKAAHAGLDPHQGASAILELSHVVQQLYALNDVERGITVNVGNIDGGLRPNVVAPESRATVDVRVLTRQDGREIELAMRELRPTTPGTSLSIEGGFARPPMEKTPANRRLWELAKEAATALEIRLGEATAGGGSDGNTTSLFAPTLDGLGAVGDGAHSSDEFLFLDKMAERAALLAMMLAHPPIRPVVARPRVNSTSVQS